MKHTEQCGNCNGTGRMVRDPDIGTDQECFVCDGTGLYNESSDPQDAINCPVCSHTTQPSQAEPNLHQWDDSGERCVKCGDKDWMADKYCSGLSQAEPQQAERSTVNEQCEHCGTPAFYHCKHTRGAIAQPMHPSPAQGPLTDEQIIVLFNDKTTNNPDDLHGEIVAFARAIERAALAQQDQDWQQVDKMLCALKYIIGIAERGLGRAWDGCESAESFVLGYVQQLEQQGKDAERYRFVKTMTKEQLLFWRGAYGMSDAAIDAAIAAKGGK